VGSSRSAAVPEPPHTPVAADIMREDPIHNPEDMDQEAVSRPIAQKSTWCACRSLDADAGLKGHVTVERRVDVYRRGDEDMPKVGGGPPSTRISADSAAAHDRNESDGAAMFSGDMLTASAIGFFEKVD